VATDANAKSLVAELTVFSCLTGPISQLEARYFDLRSANVGFGPPSPLTLDYWADQVKHRTGEIVSSHLVKYPYSFLALAKELRDDRLKEQILEKI
jgi:hypothetical protein